MKTAISSVINRGKDYFASKSIPIKIVWTLTLPSIIFILTLTFATNYTSYDGFEDYFTGETVPSGNAPFSLSITWWIWCLCIALIGFIEIVIWDKEN